MATNPTFQCFCLLIAWIIPQKVSALCDEHFSNKYGHCNSFLWLAMFPVWALLVLVMCVVIQYFYGKFYSSKLSDEFKVLPKYAVSSHHTNFLQVPTGSTQVLYAPGQYQTGYDNQAGPRISPAQTPVGFVQYQDTSFSQPPASPTVPQLIPLGEPPHKV